VTSSREAVERVFKEERGRILATLIRVLGDIDLGEEALAAALEAALVQWPSEGTPENPRAWLIRAARNKAIDRMRRNSLFEDKRAEMEAAAALEREDAALDFDDEVSVPDDRLRLIFTCCHPALAVEAQVALTLRTLCGLETEEIARAFLVPAPTMAQRLVRAKAKIRQAGIPYRMPDAEDLPARVDAVLAVVYLVFNEGYAASSGAALIRRELCAEAIRLGRLLVELLPAETEARGLLALMLLTDARRDARVDAAGEVVLLEAQDRARWDRDEIGEGLALVEGALRGGPPGSYALQAAIAGVHARAARAEETDWREIAGLYAVLRAAHPSGVVALNHAAAVAMADGPEAGLRLMDALAAGGALAGYHLLPAARADLLRRLGRWPEAAAAYREALALVGNDADRRFLERRLAQVTPARS
jgi:RNA polymerase sigma-70 factor (ECF subfamily)